LRVRIGGKRPCFPIAWKKSARKGGAFSRDDFSYDPEHDVYCCPGGTRLASTGTLVNDGMAMFYRALQHQCAGCALNVL